MLWTPIGSVASAQDVRFGFPAYLDGPTGLCHVPRLDETLYGVAVDIESTGNVTLPHRADQDPDEYDVAQVADGIKFGPADAYEGTLVAGGGAALSRVRLGM
jgi:hypothetical protein